MESKIFLGENFRILTSLLPVYENKVDLIYIDPPYNTHQEFKVSKDGRASTISRESNANIAYSDIFEKSEYLDFMEKRLKLLYKFLSDEGSLYVHIDDKYVAYFKIMLDNIFGFNNFKNLITRIKCNPKNFKRKAFGNQKDNILFYAKNAKNNIWNSERVPYSDKEMQDKFKKKDSKGRLYTTVPVHAPGETLDGATGSTWRGQKPPKGRHWRYTPTQLDLLDSQGGIHWSKNKVPRIINFADEHKGATIQDIWTFKDPQKPTYPTEKNRDMLERIIKQSSREDSIVMDCFAGGGSFLASAAKLNRNFIGVEVSSEAFKICCKNLQDFKFNKIKNS